MPSIITYVMIGACRGFRPCKVEYTAPVFGGDGSYTILKITDKFEFNGCERQYDIDSAKKLNDMNQLIGKALQLKQDGPPQPKPKKGWKPSKPAPTQTQMFEEVELP